MNNTEKINQVKLTLTLDRIANRLYSHIRELEQRLSTFNDLIEMVEEAQQQIADQPDD